MGLSSKNPTDPRTFRLFAKLNLDGTVAATVEVAEDQPPPADHEDRVYIDVTAHAPADVFAISVPAQHVADIVRAKAALKADVAAAVAALKPSDG